MTPQEAKQKAIIEAYGEHWNTVKHHVNNDGWLYHPKGGEVTFDPFIGFMDEHPTDDAYRPRSLHGIDNNNGWIRIEPDGSNLPEESSKYWVVKNGTLDNSFFNVKYNKWVCSGQYYYDTLENLNITHYMPISVPNPPIY